MSSGYRGRDWDRRDRDQGYSNDKRGRDPSPRGVPRGYRDRDREGYRSPKYDSRSRSQSPRRDRSPYYGGPPSREIMMDGLPLDMVEEDVGHHLPSNTSLFQSRLAEPKCFVTVVSSFG